LLFLVVQKDASLGNMLYSAQINNFMSILKSDNKKTQAYAAFTEKFFPIVCNVGGYFCFFFFTSYFFALYWLEKTPTE